VLVFHDMLNLTFAPPAKFVRRYGDAATLISEAVHAFRADVRSGQYPSDEESYHLPKEAKATLESLLASLPARYSSWQALPRLTENGQGDYRRVEWIIFPKISGPLNFPIVVAISTIYLG
jgi:Ketopantoate hydroxymethyltransferase